MIFIIGVVVAAVIVGALCYLYHVGACYRVQVKVGTPYISNVRFAYKFHVGHYKDAGAHFPEIIRLCPDKTTIGVYYDDPKTVGANKCRYIVGSVLSEGPGGKVDPDLEKNLEKHGFKFAEFPEVDSAVKADHPYVNQLSIFLAVMKVYPKMEKYIVNEKLNAHPFMEICRDGYLQVMVPLSKQEEFYVEEVKDMIQDN